MTHTVEREQGGDGTLWQVVDPHGRRSLPMARRKAVELAEFRAADDYGARLQELADERRNAELDGP